MDLRQAVAQSLTTVLALGGELSSCTYSSVTIRRTIRREGSFDDDNADADDNDNAEEIGEKVARFSDRIDFIFSHPIADRKPINQIQFRSTKNESYSKEDQTIESWMTFSQP